jgi:NAD(P)-dependent dehydrogenase (short-subunit alcohol dehydrogenase family)
MVSLQAMLSHNAGICSSLPAGLVAVFVGATSGIGAATLKAFAKYTRVPRAYFVGRSQTAADTIIAECKALNPGGEYVFIEADISLIRTVDEVCARIKARETRLDILFLSQGTASLERNSTPTMGPLSSEIPG